MTNHADEEVKQFYEMANEYKRRLKNSEVNTVMVVGLMIGAGMAADGVGLTSF